MPLSEPDADPDAGAEADTEASASGGTGTGSDLPGWVAGVLLLGGTIAVAGITDALLTNAGLGYLGIAVWAICYAGALLTVWFVWLRHIELVGPAEG
ncbi:MAG: hypothetical protein ACI8UR_001982 [Natronomonas sp.]|jgi:hypothetical protein|uniref:hypothetical protein n=1 Tax=Natronomonas sp. TaxID=2184060 RepID=UPI0039E26B0D